MRTSNAHAAVIVAAGGLGTRVRAWSHVLPKEFYPVNGTPGIVHLLHEISQLGPARVIIVHHPYYARFITWARQALGLAGERRYQRSAGLSEAPAADLAQLDLTWIRQRGRYADLTSVLNGARRLRTDPFYVVFADNLYPGTQPLAALRAARGDQVAVFARPYHRDEAHRRGVIVTHRPVDTMLMRDLVEKPNPYQAAQVESRYGPDNLYLLEGRLRLNHEFVQFARSQRHGPGEPRLSLTLRDYACHRPVTVVASNATVTDLGAVPAAEPPPVLGPPAVNTMRTLTGGTISSPRTPASTHRPGADVGS